MALIASWWVGTCARRDCWGLTSSPSLYFPLLHGSSGVPSKHPEILNCINRPMKSFVTQQKAFWRHRKGTERLWGTRRHPKTHGVHQKAQGGKRCTLKCTQEPWGAKGQERVSQRKRISSPPGKGLCRSGGDLREPPEAGSGAAMGLNWRQWGRAQGFLRAPGRSRSTLQEQSIRSLLRRETFTIAGCRPCPGLVVLLSAPCREAVSYRSGVPCAGAGK